MIRAPERVGNVLGDLLRSLGLEERLTPWRAVVLWPEVVGEEASKRSQATACAAGTLFVSVASSSWMHQLSFLRRDIQKKLNDRLGRPVVREIVFTLKKDGECFEHRIG